MLKKAGFLFLLTLFVLTAMTGCKGSGGNQLPGQAQLVAIEVTPREASIAIDTEQQFLATGIYSDNSKKDLSETVAWSSSDPVVGAVVGTDDAGTPSPGPENPAASGTVYGRGEGETTITASWNGISGSGRLKVKRTKLVSIEVTPPNPVVAKGTTQRFTATGAFSDNTVQDLTASVTWTSSDTGVAAISNGAGSNGLALAAEEGSAEITATQGSVSGTAVITVNAATLASISVTPAGPIIAKGTGKQFTATGVYSDGSTQDLTADVTWTSSDTGVAAVSNEAGSRGLANSVSTGSATINAVSGSVSGSTTLTVNPAALVSITVEPAAETIAKGAKQQFSAAGVFSDSSMQDLTADVVWSSSDPGTATISNASGSSGLASAVDAGTATIKAVSGEAFGTAQLTVIDRSASLAWDAPTTNTDGTDLTDLAGYKLYYGTSPGVYTTTVTLGTVTGYVIDDLPPGTYYFAVTAVNRAGAESVYSNEASKTIQ